MVRQAKTNKMPNLSLICCFGHGTSIRDHDRGTD